MANHIQDTEKYIYQNNSKKLNNFQMNEIDTIISIITGLSLKHFPNSYDTTIYKSLKKILKIPNYSAGSTRT